MLVRIGFVEISAAQVAEMGVAFEADHMIASMGLLGSGITCRTRLGVQLHVLFRRPFLFCQLELGAWEADEVFAMPTCFADFAECEIAVFTYCKAFGWRWESIFGSIAVIGLRFIGLLSIISLIKLAFAGTSRSLTPLARTVDRCFIRFEAFLPLQFNVTLDCILLQRYL